MIVEVKNLGKKFVKLQNQNLEFLTLREQLSRSQKPVKSDFWALQNVNFTLETGEVLGVLGVNGAGKSTLFKLLSQVTTPTTGEIILRGRVACLLEVGTGFHPELSGRENIFLNGAILGMSQAEVKKHFSEIVEFAEISDFLDNPVKYYSSGMYMRLAFAIAAHLTSEIMIIDEVLAVGDHYFQEKCLSKIKDLVRQEGRTVMLVSHNLTSVSQLCTRCLWLEQGRVKMDDSTSVVVSAYANSSAPKSTRQ